MKSPDLKTARLQVFIPEPKVAKNVSEYLVKNQEFHRPWDAPRPQKYFSEFYWEKQLVIHQQEFLSDKSVRFFISKENIIIGHCNFSNIVRGPFQCCNLGFSLGQEHQGNGYMFEALQIAIAYVFNDLSIHRIQANHLPHNYRSRDLLRRLGFVVEGYARDYLFIGGSWQDHVLNSLTNPQEIIVENEN